MRRRFKAFMDVLDSMIRNAVSFAWDKFFATGPLYPVTLDDEGSGSIIG